MKRLWITTSVLLAVCLTLTVNASPTKAQETQQPSEKGYQATKGRLELKEQRVETGQREQGTPGTVEENIRQGRDESGQKQQTTEGKGEKPRGKQYIEEAKEGDRRQTHDEQGEETQQPHQKKEQQTGEKRKQYRFFFGYPIAPRSHSIFYSGIISALIDAGHHVTIVAPHSTFETSDQVRTVLVKEGDATPFVKDAFNEHRLKGSFRLAAVSPEICSKILARPDVQDLLKEEFDMAFISMILCDCFLSVVHQLKVPYALLSPVGLLSPAAVSMGSPQFPSFMGSKIIHFNHPLAFHQRLIATLFELNFVILQSVIASSMEDVCRQRGVCPPDMPSLHNMSRHASLVIHNSVRSLELPARPAVPQELYAGGIQCRPAKPLPEELEAWVQGAGEAGFIFFSMGSIIKASSMPEKTRVALLEVFAGLEQRVLWKWDEDTMKDLPPNVRLAKWLPQQDILGHPRLRLFITHGGLMSTMEASYHGAAVLGLPVFGDQHTNMQLTQLEGWGRYLALEDITAETMREAVLGVMTDADIKAKAKHRAVMMRDQPMTPADTVVFWVEYVVRHRGAHHLSCPAADMPWYQLYNVDVWATVAAVVTAVTYLTIRLMVALCSCLCGRHAGKSKKD